MGASWDAFVPGPRVWAELLRVTRPGGYAIVAGGTRTSMWTAIAMMLAGWEVLDEVVEWHYAEGFPKGGNAGQRVDEHLGVVRQVIGKHAAPAGNKANGVALNLSVTGMPQDVDLTAPATAEGAIYDDTSTTLKPAASPGSWPAGRFRRRTSPRTS